MPVPKGTPLDPARTRKTVLASATPLLYARGLDGIGIAELCATLGISKETLYRHFGSRTGLVQAVLDARSDRVVDWLGAAVAAAGEDPADRIAALFDALRTWYASPAFRGCAIVNAATQHHEDPARAIAARHLGRCRDLLTGIAEQAGAADPAALGRQLLIVLEGATVVADHHSTGPEAADDAKAAALALLAHASRK
ncbi:TetR/AcrR family transcriptional regulator [Streptomyces sp. NPDC020917]|uniref:TetR/AcrR family transcriptional regulator n=1 Tax=Streptomyces sp. NPDC020917 TaxID=3365102 RepID=UPI00379D4DCC